MWVRTWLPLHGPELPVWSERNSTPAYSNALHLERPSAGEVFLTQRSLYVAFALILTVSLVSFSAPNDASGQGLEVSPEFAEDPIPEIWEEADGEDARSQSARSWIWGPVIRSATQEPYVESPDGQRAVYYFDKARMEINNPDASPDSIWYATSGLLIREMMLGEIQVGDSRSIETEPAAIPVTGDLEDNPDSPTYATLGQFTVLGDQSENRTDPQVGEPVRATLDVNGNTGTLSELPYDVEFVEYNDTLGFNIPDVFWNWMNDQPIDSQYVIGHPVTPAYWVDTRISGEETTVLVQAFERRVLTFNPENDPQWQVEAGNAGLHYRSWRDLSMPDDPSVHALAHAIPYGEIIAEAALKNGVNPYLLAGVAEAASGFDPKARLSEDRAGLMGVPLPILEQRGVEYPLDPTFNVRVAADLLAMIHNQNGGNWQNAVDEYFNWQDAVGTFATTPANASSDAISAWQEFHSAYAGEPSPFGIEPDDVDDASGAPEPPVWPPPPADDPDSDLYFVGMGEAAHYGEEAFPVERMEEIMMLHAEWGGSVDDWEFDPNGYYCVHPNYIVGERLHLTAPDGEEFWCTIADYVAEGDLDYWWSKWAIEVNWDLFEAMGIPYQETIEVRAPR
jgi:hypothetical protein